jgi:hypothetical protein
LAVAYSTMALLRVVLLAHEGLSIFTELPRETVFVPLRGMALLVVIYGGVVTLFNILDSEFVSGSRLRSLLLGSRSLIVFVKVLKCLNITIALVEIARRRTDIFKGAVCFDLVRSLVSNNGLNVINYSFISPARCYSRSRPSPGTRLSSWVSS